MDTLFSTEGLGGSATSSAGGDSFEAGTIDGGFPVNSLGLAPEREESLAWNREGMGSTESCDNNVDEIVCPYATFHLSRNQQLQLHQQQVNVYAFSTRYL